MSLSRRIGITLLATATAAAVAVLHHHFLPDAAERIDLLGTLRIVSRESSAKRSRSRREITWCSMAWR